MDDIVSRNPAEPQAGRKSRSRVTPPRRQFPSLPLSFRRAATIFSVPGAGPWSRAARRRNVILCRRMARSSSAPSRGQATAHGASR